MYIIAIFITVLVVFLVTTLYDVTTKPATKNVYTMGYEQPVCLTIAGIIAILLVLSVVFGLGGLLR
jgi:succinate dehydrogenase/fumarate reductase cytochrome b subunit